MKYLIAVVALLCLCLAITSAADAQTPFTNVYAGGISYNPNASPTLAGTALYARLVDANAGTYAFTVYDALPASKAPYTVTSNVGVGVAQKLPFKLSKVTFYVPAAAGVSFSGSNTGWQWNGGVLASIPLGKKGYHLFPNLRFIKSSVANSGYQLVAPGLMFGWGQ